MSSGPVVRELFSRDDRLRQRREFEECYSSGVRVSGRHLQVFLIAKGDAGRLRLGISIPRRIGSAVARNRTRRRLREIFRRNRSALPRGSADLVVNVRPSAAHATFSELARDFLGAVARARARSSSGRE